MSVVCYQMLSFQLKKKKGNALLRFDDLRRHQSRGSVNAIQASTRCAEGLRFSVVKVTAYVSFSYGPASVF